MSYKLTWLPEVLQSAGLKVALVDGWQDRGRAEMGDVVGIICHHTAGSRNGNMPSLKTLVEGRLGGHPLPGPLAQLGLGRDGTYYVIAAGKCNHAGEGEWQGVRLGNSRFIGIEAENTGHSDDSPWPQVQIDAYHRGVAAILRRLGRSEMFCAGHGEYALPRGRKTDPNLDMNEFRMKVAAILNGTAPPPTLIPAFEPPRPEGGTVGRPTLRRGSAGPLVEQVQRLMNLEVDGKFGGKTEAAMRAFQRHQQLVPDGIVGPKTWKKLDEMAMA